MGIYIPVVFASSLSLHLFSHLPKLMVLKPEQLSESPRGLVTHRLLATPQPQCF